MVDMEIGVSISGIDRAEAFWEGPQLLTVPENECHEAAALPDTFGDCPG